MFDYRTQKTSCIPSSVFKLFVINSIKEILIARKGRERRYREAIPKDSCTYCHHLGGGKRTLSNTRTI